MPGTKQIRAGATHLSQAERRPFSPHGAEFQVERNIPFPENLVSGLTSHCSLDRPIPHIPVITV